MCWSTTGREAARSSGQVPRLSTCLFRPGAKDAWLGASRTRAGRKTSRLTKTMSNEHPRFERDGKLLSLRELHDAIRREDEADLARVEAEGLARGMEPFDFAALLAITSH